VGNRVVDHRRPDQGEQDERLVAHALGKSARNQRWRNDREHRLKDHVRLVRDGRAVVRIGGEPDPIQSPPAEPAQQAAADVGPECQAVPPQRPLDTDHADDDEALHDGRQGVLAADQAAIEERQAWRHQQHQR
jgi:hypothetical protein